IEAQRIHPLQTKSRLIFSSNERDTRGRIMSRRQFENGGQRVTRVLRIEVDFSAHERLMRQHGPAQVEFAIDAAGKTMFQVLRDNFAEDDLLGGILPAQPDPLASSV